MLNKNMLVLTLTLLSIITTTQAKASELIIPSVSVQSFCRVDHQTTVKPQDLPSVCPQAREEDEEKIIDRPSRT